MDTNTHYPAPGQGFQQEADKIDKKARRYVSVWILIGVGMLLIQVVLGGITRLTGSGLSITEWNVVTGTLPPLNEDRWVQEFNKYRQTPQYLLLNSDFTLADFKFIFFWEWFHRFWARMIGVVFLVGFVYLVSKKYLKREMQQPLLFLFLFGAFQGAIGWIMVASGLTGDAVYVKPTRLALHFIFALALICYAYWFALQLRVPARERKPNSSLRKWTWWIIGLLFLQLIFGALMAGHKAALAAPTWPDINGDLIPPSIFRESPLLLNFFENKMTIHFIHRGLAYLLLVLVIVYAVKAYKVAAPGEAFRKARPWPLLFVVAQVILGIVTVLTSPGIKPQQWGTFEWMAQLHQVVGMLLLLSFIAMLYLLPKRQPAAA
ncbi:COX15/CtaA family protein [Paraflavitalea sp. CAU 1676]|uniref:COX15/CtaA family protein n=1 Tax=Paraflavitalea sp. CAU 1676 TaxID=3032598 RepID=UPI0023DAAB49|nr:COX15/CtaA family protein [Paraflavitalea sp. CAU 1676]MDF2190863.1 COX15/CtaA family protein [Paraflavitalea sp. CAU 1676]